MTKKNFIALADSITLHNEAAQACNAPASKFTYSQIQALADFCQSQNPQFNRERWLGYIAGTNGKNGGAR
jgi:hypothetical protein